MATKRKRRPAPPGVVLPAVRPNVGLEMAYRRRLLALVEKMGASVDYWIAAAYRKDEPETVDLLAADAVAAVALQAAVRRLARRWQRQFNKAADELADYFAKAASDRSDAALRDILRRGGYSVQFRLTAAQRDILNATTAENVALIRSIPSQYFTQIEGAVMRSVTAGRDLSQLSDNLRTQYGVTKRRAALIARDQNNKATATVVRSRQAELGLFKAVWLHSAAGKTPRPKHVAADGQVYDVRKGLKIGDKGQWVFPGEEINCRCVSKTIVPGLS